MNNLQAPTAKVNPSLGLEETSEARATEQLQQIGIIAPTKCPSGPIKIGENGPDTFHDFTRGISSLANCHVAIAMAIPGKAREIPDIYYAQVTCDCWACRLCGPIHRQQWYDALLRHVLAAVGRGETIYFSWFERSSWDATYKAIQRATDGPTQYVQMRHEDGEMFLLTTADIGGEEIEADILPLVLAKCLEYVDLGKRPVQPSDSWGLKAAEEEEHEEKPPTGMVFLGFSVLGASLAEKIKEICRRTGAHASRWGTTAEPPRIIGGYDEAWHTFGNFRALVYDVLGIRGSPCYDPDDPLEKRLIRLWEGWPEEALAA